MLVKVKVIPNATRNEVVGWMDDVLKVKIQAVPEDGKANKALCKFLAQVIGCRTSEIVIQSGEKSRLKTLELPGNKDPGSILK